MRKLLIGLIILVSTANLNAQVWTLSGSYSPTFESYNFGMGLYTESFIMDYQFGILMNQPPGPLESGVRLTP